jgi:hypothetical protein
MGSTLWQPSAAARSSCNGWRQTVAPYLSVSSGTDFTAAGYATVQLAPGTYRLTITTATGVFASLNRVPGE